MRRKRGIRPQGGNSGRGFRAMDVHSEISSPRLAAEDEEGSAESMDTEDDKTFVKQAHKGGGPAGDSDVLSAVNPAELPSRQGGSKAFSTSHGSGRNRREARYKESEDFTRSSGDSHMDTDRPGSQAEGTDEIETSPMSKRSRREPKVPGKLLPLLECLRTISSHKFGPLFRHRLESQKQQQYRNVIRRHMDLGTIRARLEEGSYSGSLEFFRDLLLIFNNALVYYPKTSQEHAAAWVLRQVAAKEMENIFKTEALLKQEGPSTRKREPKKGPEPSMKFNHASSIGVSRKRNTRSSIPAACTKPPRLSFEQFPKEDEECNKSEQLKEAAMEVSSSTPLKAKPKPKFGPESDKKPEAITLQKFKEGSKEGQEKKMRENATTAATTTTTSSPAIKAFGNNNMQPKKSIVDSIKVSNSEPKRSGSDESKKLFGSIVPGNKTVKKVLQHGIAASEPESEPHRGQPPAKRGVGRPPKHAKKSAATYSQTQSKSRDSDPPSKPRKKARR
uniref:Bromo domain-containing protein n=1 Tax=Araucaria cunninghamii TaxID=56994 RepID=A0A0D6R6X0_ARACU